MSRAMPRGYVPPGIFVAKKGGYPNTKNTSAKTTASQNTMNMSAMGIIRQKD